MAAIKSNPTGGGNNIPPAPNLETYTNLSDQFDALSGTISGEIDSTRPYINSDVDDLKTGESAYGSTQKVTKKTRSQLIGIAQTLVETQEHIDELFVLGEKIENHTDNDHSRDAEREDKANDLEEELQNRHNDIFTAYGIDPVAPNADPTQPKIDYGQLKEAIKNKFSHIPGEKWKGFDFSRLSLSNKVRNRVLITLGVVVGTGAIILAGYHGIPAAQKYFAEKNAADAADQQEVNNQGTQDSAAQGGSNAVKADASALGSGGSKPKNTVETPFNIQPSKKAAASWMKRAPVDRLNLYESGKAPSLANPKSTDAASDLAEKIVTGIRGKIKTYGKNASKLDKLYANEEDEKRLEPVLVTALKQSGVFNLDGTLKSADKLAQVDPDKLLLQSMGIVESTMKESERGGDDNGTAKTEKRFNKVQLPGSTKGDDTKSDDRQAGKGVVGSRGNSGGVSPWKSAAEALSGIPAPEPTPAVVAPTESPTTSPQPTPEPLPTPLPQPTPEPLRPLVATPAPTPTPTPNQEKSGEYSRVPESILKEGLRTGTQPEEQTTPAATPEPTPAPTPNPEKNDAEKTKQTVFAGELRGKAQLEISGLAAKLTNTMPRVFSQTMEALAPAESIAFSRLVSGVQAYPLYVLSKYADQSPYVALGSVIQIFEKTALAIATGNELPKSIAKGFEPVLGQLTTEVGRNAARLAFSQGAKELSKISANLS